MAANGQGSEQAVHAAHIPLLQSSKPSPRIKAQPA